MRLTECEHAPKEWFTQKELANALGQHIGTIRNWRKRGVFKAKRVILGGASPWLISRQEYERMVNGGVAPALSASGNDPSQGQTQTPNPTTKRGVA